MVILFKSKIAYDCKRQKRKKRDVCVCACIKTKNAFSGRLSMLKCKYIIKSNGKIGNGIKCNANEIKEKDRENSIAKR